MDMPNVLLEVIKHEGVASIVTVTNNEAHIVNTWNTYIRLKEERDFLIPVGGMGVTQEKLEENNQVKIAFGSREVQGLRYMGTGFVVEGRGKIFEKGADYDYIKTQFNWARAVLVIKPEKITQTL